MHLAYAELLLDDVEHLDKREEESWRCQLNNLDVVYEEVPSSVPCFFISLSKLHFLYGHLIYFSTDLIRS